MTYKSTIMIVDDDRGARATLEMILSNEGYDLLVAQNGPEALEKAGAEPPDLILLDVMMPGMDGFEVCQRLRADPLLSQVPIIMITALEDRDSRLRGISAGADDFVTKPFDTVELRTRVRTITRLNRYRRLLTEQAKFMWVVEQAEDGYVILDRDDHIQYINLQARMYFNLPSEERILADRGLSVEETFMAVASQSYSGYPDHAWNPWPPATASVEVTPRYLVRPESPSAKAFWLQVDVLAQPDPTSEGYIVRLHDVTEQIVLHREAHGFHNIIAHKFGTPLSGISVSLQLLKLTLSKCADEDTREQIEIAWESYLRLSEDFSKIRQYLDMSDRISTDEGFPIAELPEFVSRVGSALKLKDVKVSITQDIQDKTLSFSSWTMDILLWEILENAQKYHPYHSPAVEVTGAAVDDYHISIKIADDGLTLAPEQLAKVWTPYYQGEKCFTGEIRGMGLGLPIVATLVWSGGGKCHFYNCDARPGVVVELIIPLQRFD